MSFEFPDALVGVPVDTELTFEITFGETLKTKGATPNGVGVGKRGSAVLGACQKAEDSFLNKHIDWRSHREAAARVVRDAASPFFDKE